MTAGELVRAAARGLTPPGVPVPVPWAVPTPILAVVPTPIAAAVPTLVLAVVGKPVPVAVGLVPGLVLLVVVPARSGDEPVQPSARPAGPRRAPLVREALPVSGSARHVPHGATPSGSVRGPLPHGPRLPCV
ncbi:hypothetical protein ACFQ51_05475 [Streptomyces kaempferi]